VVGVVESAKKAKYNKNKPGVKETVTLSRLGRWDVKTINTFRSYILSLGSTPSSKALISTMVEFPQMYQDVNKNPFSTNFWTDIEGVNESRRALRSKIHLYKKDLLETVDGVNGKTLVLTTKAHKIFYKEYPLAQLRKQKWNGEWTLVMYDLPVNSKTARDYLRRKLRRLGFGCLQQSVLVSPLPLEDAVQELVEGERMENNVVVLNAKRVLGLTNSEISTRAWNLDMLANLYSKLLEILPEVKKAKNNKLLDEWKTYFLAVNFEDPYLPFELLPQDWPGEKCKKEFAKLGLPGLLKIIFG